jgi:type II secretory pathway component PulF
MGQYFYKARDRGGKLITGTIDGASRSDAAGRIGAMGYIPVLVQEQTGTKPLTKPGGGETSPLGKDLSFGFMERFQKVKPNELVMFTRQMATLFHAGIPITTSLNILAEQSKTPLLTKVIQEVLERVTEGHAFSEALVNYPKIFSLMYVNMIRAGEAAGKLDEILDRLAQFLEYEIETHARIKSATRYPKIVFGGLIGALLFSIYFIIPKFVGMFQSFKVTLPLPTRIMLVMHYVFSNYWYVIFGVIGAVIFGFKWFVKTPAGRDLWDEVRIKMPIMGPLFLKIAMSRFTRIFVTLNRSGLPILETLNIAASTVGNEYVSRIIKSIQESIREGGSISDKMKDKSIFPPLVYQMFAVGESSGTLDEIVEKVSDFYDKEVDNGIKGLASMIEPIVILFMGGMLLFLALGVFMPMWDMARLAKGGG